MQLLVNRYRLSFVYLVCISVSIVNRLPNNPFKAIIVCKWSWYRGSYRIAAIRISFFLFAGIMACSMWLLYQIRIRLIVIVSKRTPVIFVAGGSCVIFTEWHLIIHRREEIIFIILPLTDEYVILRSSLTKQRRFFYKIIVIAKWWDQSTLIFYIFYIFS